MQKTTEQLLEETLEILTSFTDVQIDQFVEELEPEEVIALNEGFHFIRNPTITEGVGDWMKAKREQVKQGWQKAKEKAKEVYQKGKAKAAELSKKARVPARARLAKMKAKSFGRDVGYEAKARAKNKITQVAATVAGGVPLIGGALSDTILRRRQEAQSKADERKYGERERMVKKANKSVAPPKAEKKPEIEPRTPKVSTRAKTQTSARGYTRQRPVKKTAVKAKVPAKTGNYKKAPKVKFESTQPSSHIVSRMPKTAFEKAKDLMSQIHQDRKPMPKQKVQAPKKKLPPPVVKFDYNSESHKRIATALNLYEKKYGHK
jgi:hypothetical protein